MSGSRRYLIAVLGSALLLGWLAPGVPAERLPPEIEAIRAERERQRAALDRIRRKVEALQEAEEQRTSAERAQEDRIRAARQLLRETTVSSPDPARERVRQEDARQTATEADRERVRLHTEAEARWREGERRLRLEAETEQAARAAAEARLRQEQQAAEARRLAEAREREVARERERQEVEARRLREERLWREWKQRLGVGLMVLYGAFCVLPFFSLYRDFIDAGAARTEAPWHTVWFFLSAGCFFGAVWMSDTVSATVIPGLFLTIGFLGLYFWFFVPGLVAQCLLFLHSLFVPHPMEAAFHRILRGEKVSREETETMTEALRNFQAHGMPADWRVKSLLLRLERLTKLLGKEKTFLDFLNEFILHQHESPNTGRRTPS